MPPAYAERVDASAARFWFARKAGAPRLAGETPEWDDQEESARPRHRLMLPPRRSRRLGVLGDTLAARPERKPDRDVAARSHPRGSTGVGYSRTSA